MRGSSGKQRRSRRPQTKLCWAANQARSEETAEGEEMFAADDEMEKEGQLQNMIKSAKYYK